MSTFFFSEKSLTSGAMTGAEVIHDALMAKKTKELIDALLHNSEVCICVTQSIPSGDI